jgi:hypothetical protein
VSGSNLPPIDALIQEVNAPRSGQEPALLNSNELKSLRISEGLNETRLWTVLPARTTGTSPSTPLSGQDIRLAYYGEKSRW